jgi:ribosomal protein RSM22 (predicted rRNA methylase)
MRLTIPKSQGKQPYYDARKSSWGDMFPHEPKNPPHVRYQSSPGKSSAKGGDIGKRRGASKKYGKASYHEVGNDMKEKKKKLRSERLRTSKLDGEAIDL